MNKLVLTHLQNCDKECENFSQIVFNGARFPDGKLIQSRYVHDFQEYNGFFVDGGLDYIRRGGEGGEGIVEPEWVVFHIHDDLEMVREYFSWGTYGKSGKERLKYVFLKDMEEDHIISILSCSKRLRPTIAKLLCYELLFRGE